MKKFKIFKIITVLALAVVFMFLMAACAKKPMVQISVLEGDKLTKVEVLLSDFEGDKFVPDALKSDKYKDKFNAEFDGQGMLSKILSLENDFANNTFVAIYVTDSSLSGEGAQIYEKDGVKYYSSFKGINEIPLKDGLKVLFKLETY